MSVIKNLKEFAELLYKIQKSDRDNNIAVGGFTGEGKSCFLSLLMFEYGKVSGVRWNFNNMTWSRKELLKWIDGDKKDGSGRKDEYSALLVDELFMLFYKRNWFDEGQIDAIGTLNMCRDRHLLIGGNIPNFWDLDGAFSCRMRFYVYIPARGTAWIFEQENNPFVTDKWNTIMNKKIYRKTNTPYHCPNFVAEIKYPDWSPSQKVKYYEIRNKKRLLALTQNKKEKAESFTKIKDQRNKLIMLLFNIDEDLRKQLRTAGINPDSKPLTNPLISRSLGISSESIRLIRMGMR